MAYFNVEGYNSYSGCDITVTATLPLINGESINNKIYVLGSLQTLSISTHQDKRPVRSIGYINARDYVMGPRTIAGSMVFAVFNKHFASEIMADLGSSGSEVLLPDEIPALNITVNFANEYGRKSRMAIYGVKLINEGQVMSINDLYTENTYQFVALGLEPLNTSINSTDNINTMSPSKKPEGYTQSVNKYGQIIDNNIIISESEKNAELLLNNDVFNNNSGHNIVSQINNNNYKNIQIDKEQSLLTTPGSIELKARVTHAKDESNIGSVVFSLNPTQRLGIIYINKYGKLNSSYVFDISNKLNYVMSIPAGSYTAQFYNDSNESSNVISFTVNEFYQNDIIDNNRVYPIVEKVTENTIVVSSGDYTHNKIFYYNKNDNMIKSLDIGKTSIVLMDLLSNTEYCIYTKSNTSKSETITVKTHTVENEQIKMLKDFIENNTKLLISSKEELLYLISIIDNNFNNLLDSVLSLPESICKQELLIYANKLVNNFITSYNYDNNNFITNDINNTPFDSVISIHNYEKANFYNTYNNKIFFSKSINATEEKFYAVPNKHYFVQGINNNIKSIKKDFVICKNYAYNNLQKYNDCDNYKKINLDSYFAQYSNYSYETVEALAIKDNFYSDIEILDSPHVYQDEFNDIYVDVNYYILKPETTYYLSYIELHNSLDYTPVRKIAFTNNTKEIILKNHYSGLIKGRKYLFWIESNDYIKLSKPELFLYNNTNSYVEYNELYNKDLFYLLNTIKSNYLKLYYNKTVVDDLFNYVYDIQPSHKDIIFTLMINLIRIFSQSLYIPDVMDCLFELINITHSSTNLAQLNYSIELNSSRNILSINKPDNFYICALHIEESITRLYSNENKVSIPTSGYTLVYIISDNMIFKSDFVLIDNKTHEILCSNDMGNYVKKVGDN